MPITNTKDTELDISLEYKAVYELLGGNPEDFVKEVFIENYKPLTQKDIYLRLQITLAEFDAIKQKLKDKYNYSIKDKHLLYALGFDTKKYDTYTVFGLCRPHNSNNYHLGYIIYGQERVDKDWVNKKGASFDALAVEAVEKWGYDFRKDLPYFTCYTKDMYETPNKGYKKRGALK